MGIFDAIGTVVGAGADIFGAISGGSSSKKAGKAQEKSLEDALALQRQQYYDSRGDNAPFREVGTNALLRLAQGYGLAGARNPEYDNIMAQIRQAQTEGAHSREGRLREQLGQTSQYLPGSGRPDASILLDDPGYNFRLGEGLKGVERSAAARGLLGSGRTLKAVNDYAQGAASQEFGNSFNRLASLAGIGQSANSQNAALGQNYASNAGNLLSQVGDARASSYINKQNALTGSLNSLGRLFGNLSGNKALGF